MGHGEQMEAERRERARRGAAQRRWGRGKMGARERGGWGRGEDGEEGRWGRGKGDEVNGETRPRLVPARPPALSLQHHPRPAQGGSEPAGLPLPLRCWAPTAPVPRACHPLGLIPRGLYLNEPLRGRRGGGRAGVIPEGLLRAGSTPPWDTLGTWELSQAGHKGKKCSTQ